MKLKTLDPRTGSRSHALLAKNPASTQPPHQPPSRRPAARAVVLLATTACCAGLLSAVSDSAAASPITTPTYTKSVTAADAMNRTVSGGFGTATVGGPWGTLPSSKFSVSSGTGHISAIAPGQTVLATLAAAQPVNEEVQSTFTLPKLPTSGNGIYYNLEFRRRMTPNAYRVQLRVAPGGVMTLGFSHLLNNVATPVGTQIRVAQRGVAGRTIALQGLVAGSSPVLLRARVWLSGTRTPAWQLAASDSTATRLSVYGRVGIYVFNHSTSPATAVTVDGFTTWQLSPAGATPVPPAPVAVAAATSAFVHPGVLVSRNQLTFVRSKISAGTAPWTTFYAQMQTVKPALGTEAGVPYASLGYVAHPADNLACPSGNAATAPAACNDETNDGIAAYAAALMYSYSGAANRDAYAQQSIKILNAWGAKLRTRIFNATDSTSNNAPLQASWAGSVFAKTAELIRYTYTPPVGQPALNVANLTAMFNSAYLPYVNVVWYGGGANWLMSFDEATMNIAVFENNRTLFDSAVSRWKAQVPSIVFMAGDANPWPQLGGSPIPPPTTMYDKSTVTATAIKGYWHNPTQYVSSLEGETCRDAAHMSMGFGAMVNVAETARLQGVDLYNFSDFRTRISKSIELNTGYIASFLAGQTPSNWKCATPMAPSSTYGWQTTFEVAVNEFVNRLGVPMPNTSALLATYSRRSTYKAAHNSEFEALTSYGTN